MRVVPGPVSVSRQFGKGKTSFCRRFSAEHCLKSGKKRKARFGELF